MKSAEELKSIPSHQITPDDMEGWKKISQDGSTFITASFWNSTLKEEVYLVTRDYDYDDCRNDNDYLYGMPVDEEALRDYRKHNGIIQEGDKVKVVKGRTLPKGFIGVVKSRYKILDRYGRYVTDYLRFYSGEKINITNVELIRE